MWGEEGIGDEVKKVRRRREERKEELGRHVGRSCGHEISTISFGKGVDVLLT